MIDSITPITNLKISDKEFNTIRGLVYNRFGINLTDAKRGLVVGRLQKVLREKGFSNFSDYIQHLENDTSQNSLSELINRISTNHTYFYREKEHFEFLIDTALPEIISNLEAQNDYDLRIWCAGCSSGEEPYTLAMLLLDYLGSKYPQWKAGVLATDISEKVLKLAIKGIYHEERLTRLPVQYKNKYFKKVDSENWQISEKVRKEITFRRFNLMNKTFPFKKPFHIIFCRNVMIYFDAETRKELIQKYHHSTVNGGYLFIGHSESLGRNDSLYNYIKPAVYKKS